MSKDATNMVELGLLSHWPPEALLSVDGRPIPSSLKGELLKEEISRIFITQGASLIQTRETLQKEHGFSITLTRLERMLRKWGLRKNLKVSEINFIIAKAKERASVGKDTDFFFNGKQIPKMKIKKLEGRLPLSALNSPHPYSETHPSITFNTPRPSSPDPSYQLLQDHTSVDAGILSCDGLSHQVDDMLSSEEYQRTAQKPNLSEMETTGISESCFLVAPSKMDKKSDWPLTDSGYQSAPNLGQSSNIQPLCEISRGGAKTLYSTSNVDAGRDRKYVIELADNIYEKLCQLVDTRERSLLPTALPNLIKAFAIKLGLDATSPVNRNIMCFIHQRHREIAAQLEAMLIREEENEPDCIQRHLGDMPLLEKMSMWESKNEQDHSAVPKDDYFEGIPDEEEASFDDEELLEYHKIILDSAAYKWFLRKLRNECVLQMETPQSRIRALILDKLPTGEISRRRSPDIHELTFDLEWPRSTEEMLRFELWPELKHPSQASRPSIIMTGSLYEAQGLTIKEYLAQTWPAIGLQLLDALGKAKTSFAQGSHADSETIQDGAYHSSDYIAEFSDNTQVKIATRFSRIFVTVTGPAYFVADCGELLAWIGSALLDNTQNLRVYCRPLISSFPAGARHSESRLIKYNDSCNIKFELTQLRSSEDFLPVMQNLGRVYTGGSIFIQGFPIRRRPEGYPGVELSFDSLLCSLRVSKAGLCNDDSNEQPTMLKLVKRTQNVFLWLSDRPSVDSSSCCTEHQQKLYIGAVFGPLNHHVLKAGRHILSNFAYGAVPENDTQCSFHTSCTDNKLLNLPSQSESNSVNGPGPLCSNLTYTQKDGELSPRSNIRNENIILEGSSSFRYMQSKLKNEEVGLNAKKFGTSGLLPKSPSPCLASSQHNSIVRTSEDSLDSDMLSLSSCSDDIELLTREEPVYPFLKNILHRLICGYRSATPRPSSNDGGEQSGGISGTMESSHTGSTSTYSKKRKIPQGEEDDMEEDGLDPRPPKRIKTSGAEKIRKLFACPYLKWQPNKYSRCFDKRLSRIQDVKQHLLRKHTPGYYCQVCKSTNFLNEDSLQTHINSRTCSLQDSSTLTGISYDQRSKLSKKSKSRTSKEEQWFVIWDVLFPGCQKPTSVYIDTNLSREMLQFRAYCESHGPTILREHIESQQVWAIHETTEEQRRLYLDRVIAQGINSLFNNWHSNNSPSSLSLESGSNENPQRSSFQCPTSSINDSGVALEIRSSSRETASQESELFQAFGITSTQFISDVEIAHSQIRSSSQVQHNTMLPPQANVQCLLDDSFALLDGAQNWSWGDNIVDIESYDSFHPEIPDFNATLWDINPSDGFPQSSDDDQTGV